MYHLGVREKSLLVGEWLFSLFVYSDGEVWIEVHGCGEDSHDCVRVLEREVTV